MKHHWLSRWSVVGYGDGSGTRPWADKGGLCIWVPVIGLTGKEYKEHYWLVIPHQPLWLSPISTLSLAMSSLASSSASHTAPYFVAHTCCGAYCVHGQCGNCSVQEQDSEPFIFNKGMYRVSVCPDVIENVWQTTSGLLIMMTLRSTLLPRTSLRGPTPMILIRIILEISTVMTLSWQWVMLLVASSTVVIL